MPKLTAIDSVQRAVRNTLANWPLILIQVAQALVVTVLSVAGAVPLVLAIGVGFLRELFQSVRTGAEPDVEFYAERLVSNWPMLLAALAGAFCIWTVAFLVHCYAQAGVLGILAAGEAQAATASAGPLGETPSPAFRVFAGREFQRLAGLGVWKYFWLINIFAAAVLLLALALIAVLGGLAVAAIESGPTPAVFLVGCSSALFFVPCLILLAIWTHIAKAELACGLAEGDTGVWSAIRRALALIGKRFGAVLLLLILTIVAGVAVSTVFLPVQIGLDLALPSRLGVQITADLLVACVQSAITAGIGLMVAAAFISLAFWERRARESGAS